jgi:cellulose synthase/poly-beta-1,6-N-acetylglucosamine synthase-like glycosyltransferase
MNTYYNSSITRATRFDSTVFTGPVVWYQKFEYAIGHWLQKSAEHVFGCVLCSPGCFSLFRAKALMDDNIMRTYSSLPTEPKHYLQYDQGIIVIKIEMMQ